MSGKASRINPGTAVEARSRFAARLICLAGLLAAVAGAPAAQAAVDPNDGSWHFTATPYLWLPSLEGKFSYNVPPGLNGGPSGGSVDVSVSAGDILSKVKFAIMIAGDARKDDWSVATDFIGLNLESDKAKTISITPPGGSAAFPIDAGTKARLKGYIWTLAGAYTLVDDPGGSLNLFAGFRNAEMKSSLDWRFSGPVGTFPQTGHSGKSAALWDGIVGLKGRVAISPDGHWFLPYYGDVGTGSSDLTWQGAAGVGYEFEWGDLHLDYRALHYEIGNRGTKDMTMLGPMLGATFHF